MQQWPLAYFITFHTYGTWLHGQAPGSVDREHNQFGTPFLPADRAEHAHSREKMTQPPYYLDQVRREIVRDAIVEECRFRGWHLRALHVRSNHVHMVVAAQSAPEAVMRMCKSQASKRLNQAGCERADRKRWTTHGSTVYLWDEAAVSEKRDYTLNRQGDLMAVFDGTAELDHQTEHRVQQSPSPRRGTDTREV
jgi:REP element-mobilizing transposase RayT